MTSLDVQGTFDSTWWPEILKGLRDFNCSRNLYKLSKEFFNNRTAVMTTNNYSIERNITKECPQVSCSGPSFWHVLYNSLLTLEHSSRSKAIAFADGLIILTRGETVSEAENYTNVDLRKIEEGAPKIEMKFHENKSKILIMTRRKRKKRTLPFILTTKYFLK